MATIGEGTQAAVVGTEHFLISDNNVVGVFVFECDTRSMLNSDSLELRIITKIRSTSVPNLAYIGMYINVQGDPNKYSVPVPTDISYSATLKQTQGTGRSFDWKVISV